MLGQSVRYTRFRDIQLHRGAKAFVPSELCLSIPHTNEIPVANPFRKSLCDMVEGAGTAVSSRINECMIERGWDLRRKIHGSGLRIATVSALLSLEDQHSRVLAMHDATLRPSSAYLEVHAYKNTERDEPFAEVYDWYRFGGTDILLMKDIQAHFSAGLEEYCRAISSDRSATEIAALLDVGIEKMMAETRAMLREIHKRRNRIRIIEVPGEYFHIEADHHMYPYYFRNSNLTQFNLNEFEMVYCAGAFRERPSRVLDVQRVAGLFGASTERPVA